MTIEMQGCFDFDLKRYVYEGIQALMAEYTLSELVQDQDLLARLSEFTSRQPIRFKETTAIDPAEVPCVVVSRAGEGPVGEYLGQLLQDDGEEDGDECFPAHWGHLTREQISIFVVTAHSGLRDDLYRFMRMLLVLLAIVAEVTEGLGLKNIRIQGNGEGYAETGTDPNVIYGAGLTLSADYQVGYEDRADKVQEIAVTVAQATG